MTNKLLLGIQIITKKWKPDPSNRHIILKKGRESWFFDGHIVHYFLRAEAFWVGICGQGCTPLAAATPRQSLCSPDWTTKRTQDSIFDPHGRSLVNIVNKIFK
jgi:hypothetical protein